MNDESIYKALASLLSNPLKLLSCNFRTECHQDEDSTPVPVLCREEAWKERVMSCV